MWIIPSWQVRATRSDPPEGGSDISRPAQAALDVSDNDLEVVLRVLKQNGYDEIAAKRVDPFTIEPTRVALGE